MRRISFNLTQPQILDRSKTVTRRLGWTNLKVGERLQGVDRLRSKDVKKLAVVEVVSVRRERLLDITEDDVTREGFSLREPLAEMKQGRTEESIRGRWGFINMFCDHMKVAPDHEVTRIEFRYVDEVTLDV